MTVIHRDHRHGDVAATNQLEGARQALRAESAAREQAERLLDEAQAAVRSLQTQLAHERLAKDEAAQTARRLVAERAVSEQALTHLQAELAAECAAREAAERKCEELREAAESLVTPALPPIEAPVDIAPPVQARPVRKRVAKAPVSKPSRVKPSLSTPPLSEPSPAVKRRVGKPKPPATTRVARLEAKQAAADAKRSKAGRQPKLVKWWVEGWQKAAR